MSSLAPNSVSVGTCLSSLHPKQSNYYSSPVVVLSTHHHHHKTPSIQPPPLVLIPQSESNPTTTHFKRRDAIGLALSFGLHSFFQPLPSSAAAAEAAPCELTVAPSGLAFCDKLVGTGPQAVKGQLIKAHYVGRLENGKIFDSSYNRGKPLTFRVGVGEVIKGWDEGILGGDGVPPMLAGGKRILKLPPALGYGSRGAGCRGDEMLFALDSFALHPSRSYLGFGSCVIPPDSVLLFDVEFVSKA